MKFSAHKSIQLAVLATTIATVLGCQSLSEEIAQREAMQYGDKAEVGMLHATVETTPVASNDDAADDPAIWIHPIDTTKSLILGTDKKAGIAVYNLAGEQVQFLAYGLPNNVDIRQGVMGADGLMDVAAFSDRADDSVGFLSVSESGVEHIASFPVGEEPYGFCLGQSGVATYAFVTYKTGLVEQYRVATKQDFSLTLHGRYQLASQLEGCVYDDVANVLFVGEEENAIWKFTSLEQAPIMLDQLGSNSGLAADIEGLAIYRGEQPYLVVSSQGNDSYALYDLNPPHAFVKRFRVVASGNIDGAQETDGLDANATPMGERYPNGILVVQDGYNQDPSNKQNFKIIPANF